MSLKLPIRGGDVRVQSVGHCQVEEAWDLVQLLDSVGKTSLPMACSLEGEEHIDLFGAPDEFRMILGDEHIQHLAEGSSSQSKLYWWKTMASNISTLGKRVRFDVSWQRLDGQPRNERPCSFCQSGND